MSLLTYNFEFEFSLVRSMRLIGLDEIVADLGVSTITFGFKGGFNIISVGEALSKSISLLFLVGMLIFISLESLLLDDTKSGSSFSESSLAGQTVTSVALILTDCISLAGESTVVLRRLNELLNLSVLLFLRLNGLEISPTPQLGLVMFGSAELRVPSGSY